MEPIFVICMSRLRFNFIYTTRTWVFVNHHPPYKSFETTRHNYKQTPAADISCAQTQRHLEGNHRNSNRICVPKSWKLLTLFIQLNNVYQRTFRFTITYTHTIRVRATMNDWIEALQQSALSHIYARIHISGRVIDLKCVSSSNLRWMLFVW